jgi:uncharacterized protein YdbL (DUF1318 family)
LPARDAVVRAVERLAARVRAEGGTARVLSVEVRGRGEYDDLVAEFNAARDVEYAEVLERTPAFLAEIAQETARGRATYAEVEESEADLARFRAWLAKITARDYFGAPGGGAARAAVLECARVLAEFEQAALHAEAGDATQAADTPATRPAGAARHGDYGLWDRRRDDAMTWIVDVSAIAAGRRHLDADVSAERGYRRASPGGHAAPRRRRHPRAVATPDGTVQPPSWPMPSWS